MDRIQGVDTVALAPGKPGFRSKDTIVGIPGTVLTAKWANDVQEEVCGIVEAAGLVLDPDRRDQLLRAVRRGTLNTAVAGGSADALTATLNPAPLAGEIAVGTRLALLVGVPNTGPAALDVNGLGANPIVYNKTGAALDGQDWIGGSVLQLVFDGASWRASDVLPSFLFPYASLAEVLAGVIADKIVSPGTVAHAAQSGAWNYAVDYSGIPDALTVTLNPAPAAYTVGFALRVLVTATNTGAATINVNGLGAVPILRLGGGALQAGDLSAGAVAELAFDGTQFQTIAVPAAVGGIAVFNGNGSFVMPAGVVTIKRVRGWGAGGGGGGSYGATAAGSGGGGGAYGEKLEITVAPGSVVPVTIGVGGAGGTNGNPPINGSAGGTTSFGSYLTIPGGGGGLQGNGGIQTSGCGGGGVAPTNAGFGMAGTPGGLAWSVGSSIPSSGIGGASPFGGGCPGPNVGIGGGVGHGPGGGGNAGAGGSAGGKGANGMMIVEY